MGFPPNPLHLLLLFFIVTSTFTSSTTTASPFEEPKSRHLGEVSGEEEIKSVVLESFRALLGISSTTNGSPSPSPAPAPVPSHIRPKPELPRAGRIHPESGLEHAAEGGGRDRVGRFVVVGIVSAGAALVISALAVVIACCGFKKNQRERSGRAAAAVTRSFVGFASGSSCSLSKASFDCRHDFTFLDSPDPPRKQSSEGMSNAASTTSDSVVASGEGSAYETVPIESDSDHQSFHSVCAVSSASDASKSSRSNSNSPARTQLVSASTIASADQRSHLLEHPLIPTPPPLPPKPPSHGNSSTPRPPSPPIPQLQEAAGTPLPKLKPLHWDKVRAPPDRSMVWDKLRSSSFELDEEMIESLFGYNLQSSGKSEEAKNKSYLPRKHVMNHKRLQNVTILFKALNATAEEICLGLIQGDGLSAQQLEVLVNMMPTKEEEEKLSNFEGNIAELDDAERLIKAMLIVPFAFNRIEAMLYKHTFEDEVVHLKESFEMLEEACKELRSSRLFLRLLEAVLKTGNRMNVGTIRGGAEAFKLDALLKLADVKGTDGRTTLLHFVAQEMIRTEGEVDLVSRLGSELRNVKKTASVDLCILASSVSSLYEGLAKHRRLVKEDSWVESMGSFVCEAEMRIEELRGCEERVMLHLREVTEYFHGDASEEEANPLRIFVIVRDFLGMLDGVCREVRCLKGHQSVSPVGSFR
ncbi:Formin-like protein 11 [Acorus gramineus]|uniref:Formin-like protein n=1 Tax=Acorus gramineus TaxID=55184 RepID=A0AAV9BLP5_ACOGR|nr:Formin-like protein 11 [Acorus gramineus]